jgi:hypothetical protein
MKTKPIDLPIHKLRGNILNRLQQANTQIRIWRALRVDGFRHGSVGILDKYPLFTNAWPDAILTTFVIQLCSLFDRGGDCIVIRTYESRLKQIGKDTRVQKGQSHKRRR